ncbi:MAG TPA: hypothetical protein PKE31_20090 [Pseudomonadota bacterium]|jgi:hypothetical protein|nr:hypothetical protein [Pseudomonadota bacterium]
MDGSHGPRCETEAECYALNMPSRKIHFTAFVADLKINRFMEGAGLRPSYMWFIQPAEIEYDLQSDLNEAELIAFFRRFMNTAKPMPTDEPEDFDAAFPAAMRGALKEFAELLHDSKAAVERILDRPAPPKRQPVN